MNYDVKTTLGRYQLALDVQRQSLPSQAFIGKTHRLTSGGSL